MASRRSRRCASAGGSTASPFALNCGCPGSLPPPAWCADGWSAWPQHARLLPFPCLRLPGRPLPADYCFGDRKFGGNAQAITKDRCWGPPAAALPAAGIITPGPRLLAATCRCQPTPAVCNAAAAAAAAAGAPHRRWVHHTSLLWDFQRERMALLRQPSKQPEYRQASCRRTAAVLLVPPLACAAACRLRGRGAGQPPG